ncbi:unnamed protein product [Rotaria sordida]|uniref:Phytanoyl-CoA dioxygenase n=1 Tax=Rotaria sordida TaxID=392033 RepID=A0A814AY96_9BILA|nr:unnamed protein product [Rotaria sordida]CAF1007325.1 unnamed protein product [Rotaria sordida]CAF3664223.1 unnamed protein product [Rotaria sordida]CAF3779751.1 unnamed protein product [Rotaria sordida]
MDIPVLLTDRQVQEFLINGYLLLQPKSLDENFHSTIFTQALSVIQKEGNPGNNILPRVPLLQRLFDDPVITGALESLLGSNYVMQPHRHPHLTSPGSDDQSWHKDSFFGYRKLLRHHQLRYVMIMYYPQDTTVEMGPTGIKPRTQYDVMDPKIYQHNKIFESSDAKNDDKNDIYVVCMAGTVVLIHYDIVHRGTANTSSSSYRFMFKFQFNRMEEPTKPTWNHDPANVSYDATDAGLLQPVVKHIWNWMLGHVVAAPEAFVTSNDITRWKSLLNDRDGKIRLNAAYNLALCNEYDVLINRLYDNEEIFRFEATYALTACRYNKDAITKLQEVLRDEKNTEQIAYCIAFIFSEMGPLALDTLPLLIDVVQTNNSWLVQQYCCEALGTIQSNRHEDIDEVIQCLTNVLSNRDEQNDSKQKSHARFVAALSIAKLGTKAVQAVPVLKGALYLDQNRYVNGNALLALERIGTNEALKIMLNYLKTSRWCAKTTTASQY